MGNQESQVLLQISAVILVAVPRVQANIWHVSIDEGPAPSPEDGPPFSAHASRDRALLPGQICGIVGAYIGSILILGILLLTVGRRLRSAAQSSQSTLAMEMVKPSVRAFDGSPVSPASTQRSWYSPKRPRKKPSASSSVRSLSNPASPGLDSIASFDNKVIEADKAARQQEMERLYAAVMARNDPGSTVGDKSTARTESQRLEEIRAMDRKPLRLLTSAPVFKYLQNDANPASPTSPTIPRSPIRAIYPPDSPRPRLPQSPTSPIRAEYPTTSLTPHHTPGPYTHSGPSDHQRQVSRPTSQASQTSSGSRPTKPRRSLRKIKISAPIPKYPGEEDDDSARTPLSPRYYPDPGQPPSPPSPPRSEGATTPGSHYTNRTHTEREEAIDQIRDLPRPAPQRISSYEYNNVSQATTDIKHHAGFHRQEYDNAASSSTADGPSLHTPTSHIALGSLPFRANQTSQPVADPLKSPSRITKTTHLERGRDVFLAVNGPPRTGLATPYSPYMPFTPVTPVTPHLTSRRERRQREREEGRRVLGWEDAVVEEGEMWGSAY